MSTEVLVYCGEQEGTRQPEFFRCCPLGMQFYSPTELPTYRVLELQVAVPEDLKKNGLKTKSVDCSGVVVHSQWDNERELFRTWVLFADLPQDMRDHFRCLARESDFLCPHCENY